MGEVCRRLRGDGRGVPQAARRWARCAAGCAAMGEKIAVFWRTLEVLFGGLDGVPGRFEHVFEKFDPRRPRPRGRS